MAYDPSADFETAIVEAVVDFLEGRYGEPLTDRRWMDREVRDAKAIELIATGATQRFAIEHTRLNSFSGQIADDAQLLERLWPLVIFLKGRVPGRFELEIDAGSISRLSRQRTPVALKQIVEWILTEAPNLDAKRDFQKAGTGGGKFTVAATLSRVPFELRLTRLSEKESMLILARRAPSEYKDQRQKDVARSLEAKNPKLARSGIDCRRLLILETRDFQLQSASSVAQALEIASKSRTDMPELVYLVETDFGDWQLFILKEDDVYSYSSGRNDVGPFRIGVTAPEGPESRDGSSP